MDLAGIQTKEDVVTRSDEISGASARAHGFVVGTMSNGDKFHVRTQGTDTYKEGNIQASQGMWSFVGGTGKLKRIKGKGTYKGKPDPEGNLIFDIEGNTNFPNRNEKTQGGQHGKSS